IAAGVSAPKTLSQKWAQALVPARAARPGRKVATTPPTRAPSAPFSAYRREVGRASALVNSSNRDGSIALSFLAGGRAPTCGSSPPLAELPALLPTCVQRGAIEQGPALVLTNVFLSLARRRAP